MTGPVVFETDPPGASVLVDRVVQGETPLKLQLTAGAHTIYMQMKGYKTRAFILKFRAGKTYAFRYRLKQHNPTRSFSRRQGSMKHYDRGSMRRLSDSVIEKDTNQNGTTDRWEYYSGRELVGVMIDHNADTP